MKKRKYPVVSYYHNGGLTGFTSVLVVCLLVAGLPSKSSAQTKAQSFGTKKRSALTKSKPADVHPGDLDTTFGTGGKVTTDFNADRDQGFALAVQTDGKIVVAGSAIVTANQPPDFALARYNTDGSLDTTFGQAGKVTTDFGGNDQASAIAVQPDGKLVVVGTTCANSTLGCTENTGAGFDFAVARYNSNGTLDAAFGTGGKVITDFNGGMDIAGSVVIQSDGRIVVGGAACTNNGAMCALSGGIQFALARYNANGSLDSTFGNGGKVFTQVLDFGACLALALQSDGKIIAGGLAFEPPPNGDADFEIVRYNSNGSLDTTFGSGGMVNTDFNSTVSQRLYDAIASLAIQPDGKIIAAGGSETNSPPNFFYDFSVARYNPDGSLDPSFGTGGKVTTDISGKDDQAGSIVIQPDGKIIVGGEAGGFTDLSIDQVVIFDSGTPPGSDFALVRYNADGSLDTGFGNGGKVTTDFFGSSDAARFALGTDGRVVGAGFARHSSGFASKTRPPRGIVNAAFVAWAISVMDSQPDADFALARYETGVTVGPDFSISFAQPTITASSRPQVVAATVNINRTGGFTGNVTITPPATQPKGIKVKGGPVATKSNSATIKIKVKGNAVPGNNTLTFTATDDSGKTRTASLTLVVQ